MTGRLWCRLGRHEREYLVTDEMVIRWCPRCKNPRAADAYPAKRLPGKAPARATAAAPTLPTDRPLVDLDRDALSTAAGLLKTLKTDDHEGFTVLAKHADPGMLLIALCCLASDALQEPASSNLDQYIDRLFARLARSRQ